MPKCNKGKIVKIASKTQGWGGYIYLYMSRHVLLSDATELSRARAVSLESGAHQDDGT